MCLPAATTFIRPCACRCHDRTSSCYLAYLWLRQGRSPWLLGPAALSLAAFAWLLALHPTAAGRVYAAYGGVYIGVATLWLWAVDKVRPTATDWVGVAVSLVGMSIIMFGARGRP